MPPNKALSKVGSPPGNDSYVTIPDRPPRHQEMIEGVTVLPPLPSLLVLTPRCLGSAIRLPEEGTCNSKAKAASEGN